MTLQTLVERHLGDIFTGVAIAVIQHGDVKLNQAWGEIAEEGYPITPITTDTLFDLASVTKLFTTTALLSLLAKHNFTIQTPVVDILAEWASHPIRDIDGGQDPHSKQHMSVNEAFVGQQVDVREITLWHLLTHTSGLPTWRDVYTVAPPPIAPHELDPVARELRWQYALDRLLMYNFVALPDTGVRYSDVGLMLVGEIVSRLADQPLDEAIDALICTPLDLENVIYNPMAEHGKEYTDIVPTEIDATWRERRVWGDVHDENACGIGGVAGHAGLFGTALDIAQFGQAWLTRDTRLKIHQDMMDDALKTHTQEGNQRRGLGWDLRSSDNSSSGQYFSDSSYGHTGFTGTSLWIDPERELVVSLLTNRVYMGREKIGIHAFRRAVHDAIVQGDV